MHIPSFKLISQSTLKKSPENSDGRTDGRTDGQTDGHCHSIIRPFFKRAYNNLYGKPQANRWLNKHVLDFPCCNININTNGDKISEIIACNPAWVIFLHVGKYGGYGVPFTCLSFQLLKLIYYNRSKTSCFISHTKWNLIGDIYISREGESFHRNHVTKHKSIGRIFSYEFLIL